jgi:hypothetical protein
MEHCTHGSSRSDLLSTCDNIETPKIILLWLLFKYIGGEFTPLSKPFKTKEQAEKARLKYPDKERKTVGIGVIRLAKE